MAILKKIPASVKAPFIFLCLIWLFINAVQSPPLNERFNNFKKKDSLAEYINYLFDEVDAHPQLADNGDSLLNHLWREPTTQDEKRAWYDLVINIGYHLLQSGQVRASSAWYEKALLFYRQNKTDQQLAAEMEFEEYICKPLGNNYTRIGDFSKALTIQQMAIASATENGKLHMLPGLYANLATTYFYMRDYAATQDIINKGISALSSGQIDIACLLYNLKTEACLETGLTDSAIYWNNKALQLDTRANSALSRLSSLTHKARILTAGRQFQQAIPYLQQAWNMAGQAGVKDQAKLCNEIGVVLFELGQAQESKQWFRQTLAFFELDSLHLYPDYNVTSAMFGLALCDEVAQQTDSASYWSVQAVLNDYYTQQLIDPWLYSKTSIYANTSHTESAIAWHHNLYKTTGNEEFLRRALWMTELSKGRMLISEQQRSKHWQSDTAFDDADFEELRSDYVLLAQAHQESEKESIRKRISNREYELSLKGKNFSQVLSAPSYERFMELLNEKRKSQTILSYFNTSNTLYIIRADQNGISHFQSPLPNHSHITSFINTYFYNGPQAFNNNPTQYFQEAYTLFNQYLPGGIRSGEDLTISASGNISLLPFEALTSQPDKGTYLGAHHAINYQVSLLQLTHTTTQPAASIRYFGFEEAHLNFPGLPSSKTEKKFLQGRFRLHFENASQTEDSLFYQALNQPDIIHLATHAVAGNSAAQSFVVLKNKLYLEQLQYNTTQCPLVVLAACETGKGTAQQNEGVMSLGRAFISKGVGGVLSARWEADDQATSDLIKAFYQELATEKHPAKALRNARSAYLNDHKDLAGQNPWLWAAMFYQGNNHPVDIQTASSPFLIGLSLLVLGFFIVFLVKGRFRKQ